MTEFGGLEVTLHGWRDVRIHLLTNQLTLGQERWDSSSWSSSRPWSASATSSNLQYNSLGFRPVRNDDDDFSDDDYFYGQKRIKDWAPRTGARVKEVYQDSPSEDEGEDENNLFEKTVTAAVMCTIWLRWF